ISSRRSSFRIVSLYGSTSEWNALRASMCAPVGAITKINTIAKSNVISKLLSKYQKYRNTPSKTDDTPNVELIDAAWSIEYIYEKRTTPIAAMIKKNTPDKTRIAMILLIRISINVNHPPFL